MIMSDCGLHPCADADPSPVSATLSGELPHGVQPAFAAMTHEAACVIGL